MDCRYFPCWPSSKYTFTIAVFMAMLLHLANTSIFHIVTCASSLESRKYCTPHLTIKHPCISRPVVQSILISSQDLFWIKMERLVAVEGIHVLYLRLLCLSSTTPYHHVMAIHAFALCTDAGRNSPLIDITLSVSY